MTQPNQYEDTTQKDLIDFVTSESTIRAAAEGSMEKRQAVFDQYEDKELPQSQQDFVAYAESLGYKNVMYLPQGQKTALWRAMKREAQKQLEARIDELRRIDPTTEWTQSAEHRQVTIGERILELTKQEGEG